MRTNSQLEGSTWRLSFELEGDDPERGPGQDGSTVGLRARRCRVELPVVPSAGPHPDAEALATFVIVRPWVGSRLVVQRGVSRAFAELVKRVFRIDLGPVDPDLAPRTPGSTPLLSYSAGFDSTAASALLPEIPHLHHRRITHPDIEDAGAYRADAIERLAVAAGERGRSVHVTRADFEHLVDPFPSLPHWFGFAVGPLLLADHFDAGALVLGSPLETWYMDMGRRWTGQPRPGAGIDPLPALVGLPIMRPLVGVTEIGTMRLTLESGLADLARSCVAGTVDDACHRCAKCLRKDMVRAVLEDDRAAMAGIPDDAPGWQPFQVAGPYYMQAQFEWAAARIPERLWPPSLRHAVEQMGGVDARETDWMSRAYRPAVACAVPEPWQVTVAGRLEGRLGWMTDDDVSRMQAWDCSARPERLPAVADDAGHAAEPPEGVDHAAEPPEVVPSRPTGWRARLSRWW